MKKPKVGTIYRFSHWEVEPDCPLGMLRVSNDSEYKDPETFEIIDSGNENTIAVRFPNGTEVKFPNEFWNPLTYNAEIL